MFLILSAFSASASREMFTTADALTVLKASAGLITLTESQAAQYNLNGDGEVNTTVALMILRMAAGLPATAPGYIIAELGYLPPAEPLSPETELKLLEAWAAYKGGFTAGQLEILHYFGTFNGYEVVVIYPKGYAMTADMQYIHSDGYDIALGSGSLELLVYADGALMHILEARDKGLLTENDIKIIAGR